MWQKVVIVSECQKKTRKKSHAILDKYLYRIGSQTWEGRISSEGLRDLYTNLKTVRSKNMSIVTRLITKSGSDKILWTIGNKSKFSELGYYSIKSQTIKQEKTYRTDTYNFLFYCTMIASLFHDFGKITNEFQKKIRDNKKTDRVRHELISLYLFDYLYDDIINNNCILSPNMFKKKTQITSNNIKELHETDLLFLSNKDYIKQIVRYLIISHHKIPEENSKLTDGKVSYYLHSLSKDNITFPGISTITNFLTNEFGKQLVETIQKYLQLALSIKLSENIPTLFPGIMSYGRISLLMADHYYSSLKNENMFSYIPIKEKEGLFANTGKNSLNEKCLVQPLNQHLVGVSRNVNKIMRNIFKISNFPIWDEYEKPHSILSPPIQDNRFDWQYYAHQSLKDIPENIGFIGFMMSGTGSGKTRANMIIMSELNKKTRFTVALGLRNLTLQTGSEYEKILGKNNLSVHIGSEPILQMYNKNNNLEDMSKDVILTNDESGSEIEIDEDFFMDNCEYQDKPDLVDIYIKKEQQQYMLKPILVSTIDSLMYCEKKPHMALRLMSSDLIIDEIDNYDVVDQIAIMRLIKLSASYGRKVLISSATLPPETAEAMYKAYYEGYYEYCLLNEKDNIIYGGWFSEFNNLNITKEISDFNIDHNNFISQLSTLIINKPAIRKAGILHFDEEKEKTAIFNKILNGAVFLHEDNFTYIPNTQQKLSVGLIRIPDISIVAELSQYIANSNIEGKEHRVLCYHSNFPLIVRDTIEQWLDRACNRKNENLIFQNPIIKNICDNTDKDIMIIVVSTPVEEVGRDHDFDYMINSMSSYQTLIQAAGRVKRHRPTETTHINCLIMERPLNAYKKYWKINNYKNENIIKIGPAFLNPGVETNLHLPNVKNIDIKINDTYIPDVINMKSQQIILDSRYCILNNNWSLLSVKEHDLLNELLIVNNRSGYHSITEIKQLLNFGYKDYKFRNKKQSYNVDFQLTDNTWKIQYMGKNSILYQMKINNISMIADNGKYLLSYDEDILFETYLNKYFPNHEKKNIENFLLNINFNIFSEDNLTLNQLPKLVYNKYLGLYKPI